VRLTFPEEFVCLLFVGIKPEKPYFTSCLKGSKTPGSDRTRTQALLRARDKDSGTDHVLVNLWLTPYKLTGWLTSLDLRQPHTKRILSH